MGGGGDEEIKITKTIQDINKSFKSNHFDFIITNPPFGSIVRQTERAYLKNYKLSLKECDWLDIKESKETYKDQQSTEILFIEQAHNFLKENGYLAIVIPDGILTNSSLQHIRDKIEEFYRIIAVISMPQSAFSPTGAGVKSSVLFLKKYSQEITDKIRSFKSNLQSNIKKDNDYKKKYEALEKQKKLEILELNKNYPSKEDRENEDYKNAKNQITQKYKTLYQDLQDPLRDDYIELKKAKFKEAGLDYDIFMALAEDIGYDATGKKTQTNELDYIGIELKNFIENIEGKNSNFL